MCVYIILHVVVVIIIHVCDCLLSLLQIVGFSLSQVSAFIAVLCISSVIAQVGGACYHDNHS